MNVAYSDGKRAIVYAMQMGLTKCVNLLIHAGANLNVPDSDALVLTAGSGHVKHLDSLIKSGANVNQKDSEGDTALNKAAFAGHDACVDLLIKSGADVNSTDSYGGTALMSAARKGQDACVDLLIKSGANVNVVDSEGRTALIPASQWGNDSCMDLLIKAGADVNITDSNGGTALTYAIRCIEYIKPECLDILLNAGADVNVGATIPRIGTTLLHGAASEGDEQLVRKLLQANSKINVIDEDGYNALTRHIVDQDSPDLICWDLYCLLYVAGEKLVDGISQDDVPEFLLQKEINLNLKHICREAIRKHLLDADPHSNLFGRISRLGLPSGLTEYLLFKQSLNDDEIDMESFVPILSMLDEQPE